MSAPAASLMTSPGMSSCASRCSAGRRAAGGWAWACCTTAGSRPGCGRGTACPPRHRPSPQVRRPARRPAAASSWSRLHNTESAIRQYDLRGKAIALGWDASQITVIDIDQGQSGASAADREGFQQLVAEVGMGRAGIVLGLECSRLARNNADWHQLLELCAMTGTLICDEDGLYDPRNFNDRLVLGMKGQISEALCRYRHRASYADPVVMPTGRR